MSELSTTPTSDFVGRGFTWPLGVDHTGSIALTRAGGDLEDSIRVVLLTAPGERLMRPQFGCRIWDLLFEPVNANLLGLISQAVRDALAQWEPRIEVEDVTPVQDAESSGTVQITHRLPGPRHQRPAQPGLPVLRDPPRGRLMPLDPPNLDDRTFQDIVDEAKRLIPRFTPEWTNHNVSDPGVALIELFAWMSEMVLYRVNQVPDRLYVHFLNLVGIEPFPPSVARADLTFWLSSPADRVVRIPAGTEVLDGPRRRRRDRVLHGERGRRQPADADHRAHVERRSTCASTDVWDDLTLPGQSAVCFPSAPLAEGDALYLGSKESLAGFAIRLDLAADAQGIGVDPRNPPLVWEAWNGEAWIADASCESDGTGGLNRPGRWCSWSRRSTSR